MKAALAAEQASVPCPASTALPNSGQSSSTASLSSAMAFGGVPSLLSSQASAFAASGAGFAAHSTSTGASAAQGRPALVVPTFVSTFLPPNPSHSLSIANMATTSSQDSVSSAATLPQANISSATSFPVLNQPFIVGPGFSPIPAKVVGQVVAGKFIDLGDLLPSTVVSADPEPQLLFDGRLVLTSTPKKPKRRIEDIATWMEAFSVFCLIMISFFPHRSRDPLQYKLLILRTYRQFRGKVWLAYDRAFREHAAAANVVDWSFINVQLFNFHAAGASARGPNVSSPELIRTSWSQYLADSVQVMEQRSLCGPLCLMSLRSPLFQLLWRTSCCQLPRVQASPAPSQVKPPLAIPVPFLQQVSANMNSPFFKLNVCCLLLLGPFYL